VAELAAENLRLRKELNEARMEREMLKKQPVPCNDLPSALSDPGRGPGSYPGVHRGVLQPNASSFGSRKPRPGDFRRKLSLRKEIRLKWPCLLLAVQANPPFVTTSNDSGSGSRKPFRPTRFPCARACVGSFFADGLRRPACRTATSPSLGCQPSPD